MTSILQAKICLITPPSIGNPDLFFTRLNEALSEGIRFVQYRNKECSKKEALRISIRLRELTARYRAIYIVNDDLDIALASDADGVHIGQKDLPIKEARKLLGKKWIIGVSTHNLNQALEAQKGGADYIGFGSVFTSGTKNESVELGTRALQEVARGVELPVIAIGGISASNIEKVFECGAKGAAVISAVWEQDNIKYAVKTLFEEVRKVMKDDQITD
ncbi:MAG: thiamine phosphate synthase [Nitrospirae bacterium]|nr:thiamine phosphate synthase [Nitrospirota bacterium]MBI3594999.1 thiamine phosphate synthase [Nitrospirota bacterium]